MLFAYQNHYIYSFHFKYLQNENERNIFYYIFW